MSEKMSLSDLYTASRRLIDFGKETCKLPTKTYPPHYCLKCGTELNNVYMENRVYLVACPKCEISSLVEAVSPMNALMKVGGDGMKAYNPDDFEYSKENTSYIKLECISCNKPVVSLARLSDGHRCRFCNGHMRPVSYVRRRTK